MGKPDGRWRVCRRRGAGETLVVPQLDFPPDFFGARPAFATAGAGVGRGAWMLNFFACSRTITSNMFVRLRFSVAAHCSQRSRTSGVSFSEVAAVFRSGRGMVREGSLFKYRKPLYVISC